MIRAMIGEYVPRWRGIPAKEGFSLRRHRSRRLILAALAVALAPGCDSVQDRFRECRRVTVTLVNDRQSLTTANLIVEDEAVRTENLLAPGGAREVVVCVERGDRKRFLAVRDGQIFAQATCVTTFSKTDLESARPRVVLQPAGIACEGW